MKRIPVCEPTLLGNEKKYINEAIDSGWISSAGKYIELFEKQFAKYCNSEYAVATNNGTTAIHVALKALGIGKGDEVIIPDFTMISTAFAVCYTGAIPVFIDAEKDTWNIDPQKIEKSINKKTKAIMVVHIFGLPCDMEPIQEIAKKHNLYLIEDAAEAHGATYDGRMAGNMSSIATFSFYANKNITCGEGGMVVTNSKEFYNKTRYYKNLCFPLDSPRVYFHENIGFNYRMSNLHAAIGLAQLEKAEQYKIMRQKIGKKYRELLKNIPGIIFQKDVAPITAKKIENVNWMNAIIIDYKQFGKSRDELIAHLYNNNIETRLLFIGMHAQPSLKKFGCRSEKRNYQVSQKLTETGLYLPSSSSLLETDIEYISETIRQFRTK